MRISDWSSDVCSSDLPIKPLRLISDLLTALQTRNDLDTSKVNDVILGCSQPLGEQGGAIGKSAALLAGWDDSVAGCQIDRFCGSGLEAINIVRQSVVSGKSVSVRVSLGGRRII